MLGAIFLPLPKGKGTLGAIFLPLPLGEGWGEGENLPLLAHQSFHQLNAAQEAVVVI